MSRYAQLFNSLCDDKTGAGGQNEFVGKSLLMAFDVNLNYIIKKSIKV